MARIKIGKKKLLKEKFEVITVSWLVGGVGAFALLSNRYMRAQKEQANIKVNVLTSSFPSIHCYKGENEIVD